MEGGTPAWPGHAAVRRWLQLCERTLMLPFLSHCRIQGCLGHVSGSDCWSMWLLSKHQARVSQDCKGQLPIMTTTTSSYSEIGCPSAVLPGGALYGLTVCC